MPKPGSAAPIGYIYNPDPACKGNGGLLAAVAAFFAHQGHKVFHDPCLDLAEYRQAWGVMLTIVDVDHLPDHVLTAGLDLLDSLLPLSKGDILGMSFMVEYFPTPLPAGAPQGLVSLSPPRYGGLGRAFAPFIWPVISRSTFLLRLVSRCSSSFLRFMGGVPSTGS